MKNTKDILNSVIELKYFLKPLLNEQKVIHYELAPFGHLLCENIKKELTSSCVLRREEPAFTFSNCVNPNETSNMSSMFHLSKSLSNGKLPFIMTDTSRCSSQSGTDLEEDWMRYFRPSQFTCLRAYIFTYPSSGQQLFYHWQSQRKYWWRKFLCNPGRISLAETISNKEVSVQIELPCGRHQTLETILNYGSIESSDKDLYEIKEGRKKVIPYLIESSLNMEVAALAFLSESLIDRGEKQVLKLHRKLAPYKISFVNSADEELRNLALYLYENLRKNDIFCAFIPLETPSKISLENQLSINDALGIPYTVILRESSLRDGLISIRNRDTTLEEKLHISKLVEYMHNLLIS